jgi:hypothetical protein
MATQSTLLEAVQLQLSDAETATLPVPPEEVWVLLVGVIVAVQVVPPCCVKVKVRPAMVTVPVREEVVVLAPTE